MSYLGTRAVSLSPSFQAQCLEHGGCVIGVLLKNRSRSRQRSGALRPRPFPSTPAPSPWQISPKLRHETRLRSLPMPTKIIHLFLPRIYEPPAKRTQAAQNHEERERNAGKVRFIWGRFQAVTPPPPPPSPLEHPGHGAVWVTRETLACSGSFSSRLDTPLSRACSREAKDTSRAREEEGTTVRRRESG